MLLVTTIIHCPFVVDSREMYFQEIGKHFPQEALDLRQEMINNGELLFSHFDLMPDDPHSVKETKLFKSSDGLAKYTLHPVIQQGSKKAKEAGFSFERTKEEV